MTFEFKIIRFLFLHISLLNFAIQYVLFYWLVLNFACFIFKFAEKRVWDLLRKNKRIIACMLNVGPKLAKFEIVAPPTA